MKSKKALTITLAVAAAVLSFAAPAKIEAREPGSFPNAQTAFPGPYQSTRSLPQGKWNMIANGRVYTLELQGSSARFSSGEIRDLRWDANSNMLSFVRVLPHVQQKFVGYLFDQDARDSKWRLAGSFADIRGGRKYGWYATRNK